MVEWSLVHHRAAALACAAYGRWLLGAETWAMDDLGHSVVGLLLLAVLAPCLALISARRACLYEVLVIVHLASAVVLGAALDQVDPASEPTMAVATTGALSWIMTAHAAAMAAVVLVGVPLQPGIITALSWIAVGLAVYYPFS